MVQAVTTVAGALRAGRAGALEALLPAGYEVGATPGGPRRLVTNDPYVREDLRAYLRGGGYARDGVRGRALTQAVDTAGLLGRGGAAFPTGRKMSTVAGLRGPRYVVANGAESEPASLKDRWLLRIRPHLVLDGLLRAAEAIDSERGYVYVADRPSAASIERALLELSGISLPVEVKVVPESYVGGEETAAVRAINGGPPKPTAKPPRAYEVGVNDQPTFVSNVETLANLPGIASEGPSEFRAFGTVEAPGTFLMTLSGACERPGLFEVPLGMGLGQMVESLGGFRGPPSGFVMGGFFGGLLGTRALTVPLAYDALRREGSGLGCGAVMVLGAGDCPVVACAEIASYFERENAKQCGACIRGTAAMRDAILALQSGAADQERVERLAAWTVSLRGRGACATLDGAALLAASLLREFPQAVKAHLSGACGLCRGQAQVASSWVGDLIERSQGKGEPR